jgi:hypothetical protein
MLQHFPSSFAWKASATFHHRVNLGRSGLVRGLDIAGPVPLTGCWQEKDLRLLQISFKTQSNLLSPKVPNQHTHTLCASLTHLTDRARNCETMGADPERAGAEAHSAFDTILTLDFG